MIDDMCPNCGRPTALHDMFSPPRCPVVRFAFPSTDIVIYSRVAPLDCATCNDTGSVCEQHLLPWPDGCGCSPGMPCPDCDRFEVARHAVEVIAPTDMITT